MPIKLPRLTWDLDSEPLGYPGIVFSFWLNPPLAAISEEPPKPKKGEPWHDDSFHHNLALVLDRVTIPAEYAGGDDLVVEIPDAKAIWDLQHEEGFDHQLVLWASRRYQDQRLDRLRIAAKN